MIRRSVQVFMGGSGLLVAALLWPVAVFAQAYPSVQQPTKQEFHASGEYEGASNGLIKAVLDGKPWLLKGDKEVKLHVTGTATADFLHPGLFVQFKAEVDRRGKASAPITDLVIFTPDQLHPIGATSSGNGFEDPGKKPANVTTAYDFAGRITGMNRTGTTINCGNITVKAEIAPEATIKIDSQDPSFASSGDKIAVKGWYQREGQGVVSEVTIELANPLTGPKKKIRAVTKPADKSDTATTPDTKKDPAKPDTAKPDTSKGTPKPDAAKPDAAKPGAVKPDTAKPDAAKPDPAKQDPAKPDATKSDQNGANAAK